MNAKEIIEKLRLTFNELVNNAAAPTTAPTTPSTPEAPEMAMPIKGKLADGTEIEVTEMAIGGIVTIQGQPAPVGDLTLEDGTILSVGDNGAITNIVPTDGTLVEDMKKDKKMGMEEVFAAFETATNEKFSSYEQKFADYEARFASYESRLGAASKVIDGLLNLTQTLSETPTGTPDQSIKTNNNFKQEKQKSFDILFS